MRILPESLMGILNQARPQGGRLPDDVHDGQHGIVLSPGRLITDPDEAEALGLTADARRMRG